MAEKELEGNRAPSLHRKWSCGVWDYYHGVKAFARWHPHLEKALMVVHLALESEHALVIEEFCPSAKRGTDLQPPVNRHETCIAKHLPLNCSLTGL
jgi:hypothetical protein